MYTQVKVFRNIERIETRRKVNTNGGLITEDYSPLNEFLKDMGHNVVGVTSILRGGVIDCVVLYTVEKVTSKETEKIVEFAGILFKE